MVVLVASMGSRPGGVLSLGLNLKGLEVLFIWAVGVSVVIDVLVVVEYRDFALRKSMDCTTWRYLIIRQEHIMMHDS